ncbi:hypothetical protein ACHQM5_014716 [Ranunculus cassubicifolius]
MNTLYSSLLLLTTIFIATTITTTTASQQQPCKDELTGISPCLPYISSPPNNLSFSPSSQCCDLYNSSFINGNASCLCYLLRHDSMLGFPLNNTRISSLTTLCSTTTTTTTTTISVNGTGRNHLDLLCQATPVLPPLEASPESNESPSPSPNPPLESPSPSPSTSPLSLPLPVTSSPVITANASAPKPAQNSSSKVLPSLLAYVLWMLFSYGLLYPSHY